MELKIGDQIKIGYTVFDIKNIDIITRCWICEEHGIPKYYTLLIASSIQLVAMGASKVEQPAMTDSESSFWSTWAKGCLDDYNPLFESSKTVHGDPGYSAVLPNGIVVSKCECGTTSVGGSKHSTWCPIKD